MFGKRCQVSPPGRMCGFQSCPFMARWINRNQAMVKDKHPKLLPYFKAPFYSLFELFDADLAFYDALHALR